MTPRENLISALDGRRPEWIPYTVNQEFVTDDPAWETLFAAGLCRIPYVHTVHEEWAGVERVEEPVTLGDQTGRRLTLRTPQGDISQIEVHGWIQEYYLKTPADYRVMTHIVRNTRLTLDTAGFETAERQVGDRGLTLVGIGRSPMQTILVDYAGLEQFSYHLADGFPELFDLAEALEDQLLERCRLTATGPGRFISLLENFTAESWGAARFRQYHLPVYAKLMPIFQAAGKRVFPHCDGRLACVAPLLAETGFAGIESLTEPPEGDLTLAQAVAALPAKVIIWANINVRVYALPPADLRRWVRERVRAAAPGGRGLVFEISEDLPPNWREAIPVVLETLGESLDKEPQMNMNVHEYSRRETDQTEVGSMKLTLNDPVTVAVSTPGETRWGHHQFPHIGRLEDGRLAVSYSVAADSAMSYGAPPLSCVSADGGKTWRAAASGEAEASAAGGIVFADGEAIKFPMDKPLDAAELKLPPNPVRHRDLYTRESDCYRLGDLPAELQRVKLLRRLPGETEWRAEWATLEVPDAVVHVWRREASDSGWSDPNILVRPHVATEFFHTLTPDGGLLNFTNFRRFNPDGTLPERGGVAMLRSDDRGRTWRLWGVSGWFRDEAEERAAAQPFLDDPDSNYNRLWGGKDAVPIPFFAVGGLYEPGVVSFGDGRMVCVMRTDTGGTHEPCFVTRSSDWGKTWTTPEILTPFGVMPKLVRLDNGVIALVYGRPGVQLLFCTDGKGEVWHTPMNLLPEPGEKTREAVGRRGMETTATQTGHDDTCGNCTVLKTGPDRFLVTYSDFRHRDAAGQRCKAICVREVKVGREKNHE